MDCGVNKFPAMIIGLFRLHKKKKVISNCVDPKIKLKATSIKEVDQWRCD